MPSHDDTTPADPVLLPYLETRAEAESRDRLGELLGGVASPLVWRVIRRQLGGRGGGVPEADLEDLHGGTLLRLQVHLASVRAGDNPPMASFADYVAVTAFNACSAFLMAREPERTRLRHRVRYVLRKDPALSTWAGSGQETLCGLAAWSGKGPAGGALERLAGIAGELAARGGRQASGFAALVRGTLAGLGAPCRVEELVEALAAALDVHDEPVQRLDPQPAGEPERGLASEPADAGRTALEALEARETLARLWAEIRELLPNQRVALLLNLRDEGGGDLLAALLSTGTADPAGLAEALGVAPDGIRALLADLPLDDLTIAGRLGLTRQQVINLRKSARLRLARRMRDRLPAMGG
jgi:hypothetical protein